jgi:alpha-tubulin suppressor-like RCC1 family protein
MVCDKGFVYAMGDNSKCQLGVAPSVKVAMVPTRLDCQTPSLIACGAWTSYAVFGNRLYSWGEGAYGALGTKTT